MASINGIQIKLLKTFRGHEGEPLYQGDVYYNGKKLGFWSQDAHGAVCDNFDFDESQLEEAATAYADNCPDLDGRLREFFRKDPSMLLGDLAELTERENTYKKHRKQGYRTLVVVTAGGFESWYVTVKSGKDVLESAYHKKFIEEIKKKRLPGYALENMAVHVYEAPGDFVKVYQNPED